MLILKGISFIDLLMGDSLGVVQRISFMILMATLLGGFLLLSLIFLLKEILVTVSIRMRTARAMI